MVLLLIDSLLLLFANLQKDMLAEFLEGHRLCLKAAMVRNLDPKRLQMSWRDSVNMRDCGVFTIRHMESYIGKSAKEWDCGLLKRDTTKLDLLRVHYLHTLCTFDLNVHRLAIMERALKFEHEFKSFRNP